MRRRQFLRAGLAAGTGLALGPGVWHSVLGAPVATGGSSPWGELRPPDANGLMLAPGFTSRVIAQGFRPVGDTGYLWHPFPDGAACYATDDGGWILVSNSEVPLAPATGVPTRAIVDNGGPAVGTGGVSALRFSAAGAIVDAYRILAGTAVNCAGGATPWGTWLSCEEWDGGSVWECDPFGVRAAKRWPEMGSFAHEAAAVVPDAGGPGDHHVYLTEDEGDGLLYRYSYGTGALDAARVDPSGGVAWIAIPHRNPFALDYQDEWIGESGQYPQGTPTRHQGAALGCTPFAGGEGCFYDPAGGRVYFTTKGDNRVWELDVAAQRVVAIYDGEGSLTGVDNIVVHHTTHDVFVAQDHAELDVEVLVQDTATGAWSSAPVVRMTGAGHTRFPDGMTVLPSQLESFERSEVTGLAFTPDGTRLYCNSQRYDGWGITYEISGPWTRPPAAAAAAAASGARPGGRPRG